MTDTLDAATLAALRAAAEAVVGELVISDTDELITVKVSGDPPAGKLNWGNIISAERALSEYLEAIRPATVLRLCDALDVAREERDALQVRDVQWVEKWKAALDLLDGPCAQRDAARAELARVTALLRDAKYVIELTGKGLGLAVDGRTISVTVLLAQIDAALGE